MRPAAAPRLAHPSQAAISSAERSAESALRIVLRRCEKALATTELKSSKSTEGTSSLALGIMRTTELITFGGGLNAPGGTSKSFCMR